jgi:DNA-binding response OmpR family regulator
VVEEASPPFEGEDIGSTHWEDARHWMSIYGDLIDFKLGILNRVRRDLVKLDPVAQRAAEADLSLIESQMLGYQERLELWARRVRDLHGLWLDPTGRTIRYQGREGTMTAREFQLLELLLDHPYRYFTVTQILGQAWVEPGLFPEEVRNYVKRVRKILKALEIPCDIVNRPGRGYSLELRENR